MRLTLYSKPDCRLCEDVLLLLDRLTPQYGLEVTTVNILDDMALYDAMSQIIPVVVAEDGRAGRLVAPIDEPELRSYLDMAQRLFAPQPSASVVAPYRDSGVDRLASWIGGHWLRLALLALGIFVMLPWITPVFAAAGLWGVANPLYTAYALTCHQLPERSGFVLGYQVGFCYRNTAIYAGIVFWGILYGSARDKQVPWLPWLLRPLPWWLFVPLLFPLMADGFSHMLGLRDTMLDMDQNAVFGMFSVGSQALSLNWWIRILTGLLAAFGAVWFAFPRMDRAMHDSEELRQYYKRQAVLRYVRTTAG